MSKQSLIEEIALLDLEHEIPEQRVKKNKKTHRTMSEEFCKKRSKIMRDQWANKEWRDKMLQHLHSIDHSKGHSQTPETRAKMRAAWTEERRKEQSERLKKSMSRPEVQEKMKKRNKGKHWWTDGVNSVLSYECPEGWREGRV